MEGEGQRGWAAGSGWADDSGGSVGERAREGVVCGSARVVERRSDCWDGRGRWQTPAACRQQLAGQTRHTNSWRAIGGGRAAWAAGRGIRCRRRRHVVCQRPAAPSAAEERPPRTGCSTGEHDGVCVCCGHGAPSRPQTMSRAPQTRARRVYIGLGMGGAAALGIPWPAGSSEENGLVRVCCVALPHFNAATPLRTYTTLFSLRLLIWCVEVPCDLA